MPLVPERVILFVDNQNMYKSARRGFFPKPGHHVEGQFCPIRLGELICERTSKGGRPKALAEVRVYTGQPSASKQPRGYGASRRQHDAWQKRGATVISRPLRYPPDFPTQNAQEKGIDVQLAIDFIALALDDRYDVGVIASTDTDLIPAIDFVVERFRGAKRVEVAAWTYNRNRNPSLKSTKARIWCHWLDAADFSVIQDSEDYAS